jgi:hypothetical protein
MKNIKIGKYDVELYDSIEDLPMIRFHKYNKMMLIDGGIGSDLSDFDGHIEKAIAYNKSKTPELANIELENLRQNIYFIQSELSPKYLAFAVLIKTIDGVEKNDLSPEGLQKVLDFFAEIPHSEITAHSEAVKKKIDEELQLYYPQLFDDSSVKEYYDELRKRTSLVLDSIINGESFEKENEIEKITISLITYNKPTIFSGSKNAEIEYNKSFENMCLLISQNLHLDPKKFTVLEFYSSFERVKEILKPNKKN